MSDIYHVDPATIPWVPVIQGVAAKPLRFAADGPGWASIVRVDPGYRVPLHRHTGDLQGVVMRGRCRYSAESPWLEAGTYVHESDGAVDEILACPEAGPEIMFMVSGPRVEYLGDDGRVVQTDDQASKRSRYQEFCSEHGIAAQDLEHRPAPPLLRDRTGRPSKDVRSR